MADEATVKERGEKFGALSGGHVQAFQEDRLREALLGLCGQHKDAAEFLLDELLKRGESRIRKVWQQIADNDLKNAIKVEDGDEVTVLGKDETAELRIVSSGVSGQGLKLKENDVIVVRF